MLHNPTADDDGPTAAELAAIEAEWPLIAAEIELLDVEIRVMSPGPYGVAELDRRRVRRAEHNVTRAAAHLAGQLRTDRAA